MEQSIVCAPESGIREELRRAGEALKQCDGNLAQFRRKHMVVLNGRSVYTSPTVTGRPALDTELMRLVRARDAAWRQHQKCMREYAEAKMRGVA